MQNHTKELYENLQTLTIFRPLLTHPLLQQLQTMLHTQLQLAQHPDAPAQLYDAISAYCDFTSEIYEYSVQNESEISGNFSICFTNQQRMCIRQIAAIYEINLLLDGPGLTFFRCPQ